MDIRTADVGNGVAGGALLPMPQDPGYATWPDLGRKAVGDVLGIFERSLSMQIEPGDPDYETNSGSRPRGNTTGAPSITGKTAGGGLLLVALLVVLVIWVLK